ncbi:MAG TPA: alpha/beta hydrolase [Steroidobacteraceae bacterium]|nr:alpha/beta hydrolase [Steroidobacteraceae bacterium]
MSGDHYCEHAGARLRWRIEGSGPAVALLHGWALDLASWNLLVPWLATRFTVLRADRRGFGLSEGVPDIHRNVDDLRAVLDAAGVGSATVVGMSQGARLALHFALAHPGRVNALLLDGAPEIEAETELPLALYRQRLESAGVAALRALVFTHPLMQLHTGAVEARATLLQSLSHYRGLDLLHPVPRAAAPDLTRIAAPTLILNGAQDSAERREAGRRLAAIIPGASRVELPNAGHLALLDDPAAYAAAVASFLDGLPGAQPSTRSLR